MNQADCLPPDPDDRRRYRRVGVNDQTVIECRRDKFGLGLDLVASALNVSETGIRIVLTTLVMKGQEVDIVLKNPGLSWPVRRRARVVWSLPLAEGRWWTGLHFERSLPAVLVRFLAHQSHRAATRVPQPLSDLGSSQR
jgi:hypothetical protein